MSQSYLTGRKSQLRISDDTSVIPAHAAAPINATNTLRITLRNGTRFTVPAWLAEGGATPVSPINMVAPTLTGSSASGGAITYVVGTWQGTPPPQVTAQWQRYDSGTSTWLAIGSATSGASNTPSNWVGYVVRVLETSTNNAGSAQIATPQFGPITASAVAPTITTNSGNPLSVSVTAGGTALTTLSATGTPAPTWSLTGTNASLFAIGATSGTITFNSASTAGSYAVTATATNSAGSASIVLTVTVTAAQTIPVITTNNGNNISSSVPAGATTLTTLAATGNPAPTWTISGTNASLFTIGSTSGVLTFTTGAVAGSYALTATATNSAGNDSINLAVTVTTQTTSDYPVASVVPSWGSLTGNALNTLTTATWTSSTPIEEEGDSLIIDGTPIAVANLAPNTILNTTYALSGITISAADANGFVTLGKSSTATDQWAAAPVNAQPNNAECVIELRAGGATTANIGLYGANVWSAGDATVCYGKVIRGPGTVTKFSGALFTVSGLSTTQSTYIHLVRKVAYTSAIRFYPGSYDSTTASASIKVRRVAVFDAGSAQYGRERYLSALGRLESLYLSTAETSTAVYEQYATNAVGTRRVRTNGTTQDTPKSTGSTFKMYSTLNYTNQPSASTFGATALNIIYEQSFYPDVPNRAARSTVSAAGWANIDTIMATMPPGPVCIDIELESWMYYPWAKDKSLASDPASVPNAQSPTGENHTAVVNLHRDIILQFKARYPGRQVGLYGPPPVDNLLPNAGIAEHVHPRAEMILHNTHSMALVSVVDFFMPCAYIAHAGFDQHQPQILSSIATEARRLAPNTKLYLFISPQVQNTQTSQYPDLTYAESHEQVTRLIELGYDGAVLWGGYDIGVPPREPDGNIQLVWGGNTMPWLQAWNDIRVARGYP